MKASDFSLDIDSETGACTLEVVRSQKPNSQITFQDIGQLEDTIFMEKMFRETYRLGDADYNHYMTPHDIYARFKPLALKLFEYFCDHRIHYRCGVDKDYEEMTYAELRAHFEADLRYVSDRWCPERLNRILNQLYLLMDMYDKLPDAEC